MSWFLQLPRQAREFIRDDRGNAGLEFATTCPLLLGVLVFTAEYGEALQARMALDLAVQDVARYLARAPVDNATTAPNNPQISLYPEFVASAQDLLNRRVDPVHSFSASVVTVDTANFREPYYVISITAGTTVEVPLLSIINVFSGQVDGDTGASLYTPNPLTLVFQSAEIVRWTGGSVPGDADCLLADRYKGLCP